MALVPFCQVVLRGERPTSKEPSTLGEHLRKRRAELGLQQKEVAQIIGVDDPTICDWENNRRTPMIRYVPKIIRFLGYTPFPQPVAVQEQLLLCRNVLGISRNELAARVGVHVMSLMKWELGKAKPSKVGRAKLQAFFDSMRAL